MSEQFEHNHESRPTGAGGEGKDEQTRRQIALLTAIIRIFRETLSCETEEDGALKR